MGYEIGWHTEEVVIALKLYGDIILDDYHAFNVDIIRMIDSTDRTLTHLIADYTEVTSFPQKVKDIQEALTYLEHEHIGWTALITDDKMATFVISTVTQMAQARFRAFTSFDEALGFIDYVDTSTDLT
jgi:hypothetical protein